MSALSLSPWHHNHVFDSGNIHGEKNTLRVVTLTATMMVIEIAAGWWYNSMALLADGWHMSSHAVALGVSVVAYALARRYCNDQRFTFGTWKIEVLGGYSSALLLAVVAALMMFESVARLINPRPIQFNQAIVVACLGLVVNLVSAWLLHRGDGHSHQHSHTHDHHEEGHDHRTDQSHAEHQHHHHDINLRAAYLHVVADATTSVFAIVALLSGKYFGDAWLDPVMGIAGAILVGSWAKGLLFESGRVLLDAEMNSALASGIRRSIEEFRGVNLCDLHLWRVGKSQYACIVSVSTQDALTPDAVREYLKCQPGLAHVTVEVNLSPVV